MIQAVATVIDALARELAEASQSGPLDERAIAARLTRFVVELQQVLTMSPTARQLLEDIDGWRAQLQGAASRKRSARLDRLDAELAQLQEALRREPAPDATPEQYEEFLTAIGHRMGRAVAQLLLRLANERKPRTKK